MLQKKKQLVLLLGFVVSARAGVFQETSIDPGNSGNSSYQQIAGSSALRGKNMDNNFYRARGAHGTVLHNVNLMTGQPFYPISLTTISASDVVSFPVTLFYAGNARQSYDADNYSGPTNWIGFGWQFNSPFIAVNHKGTVNNKDDVYYCSLGELGGGQLLQSVSGKYFLDSDPTIQIETEVDPNGFIKKWFFKISSGLRLTFGSINALDKAERVLNRIGSEITVSPYTIDLGEKFIYRWDLSRMEDYGNGVFPSKNSLDFIYDRFDVKLGEGLLPAGSEKIYTQESYLKYVVRKDKFGNEIEKIEFVTAGKENEEFKGRSIDHLLGQDIFETRYLSQINRYLNGNLVPERSWKLDTQTRGWILPLRPYAKRTLDAIRVEVSNDRGGVYTDEKFNWHFTYDLSDYRHLSLTVIDKPFNGKDEYKYGRPDYRTTDWTDRTKQQENLNTLKKQDGSDIDLPSTINSQKRSSYTDPITQITSEVITPGWVNSTKCTERYCLIAVKNVTDNSEDTYLEVWKNNGNYFSNATIKKADNSEVQRIKYQSYPNSVKFIPWGDNFIVVDSLNPNIYLYEWDGEKYLENKDFIKREASPGNPVPVQLHEALAVFTGDDYFIVRSFQSNRNTPNYPVANFYVIKKISGIWKDLNQSGCIVGASCLEFNGQLYDGNNFSASTTHNAFFIINHFSPAIGGGPINGTSAVYPFAKSLDGNSFYSANFEGYAEDQTTLINGSFSGVGYWINWAVSSVVAGEDYFVVTSKEIGGNTPRSRVDVIHFDGVKARRVSGKKYLDNFVSSVFVFPSKDYFITAVNKPGAYFEFWKKKFLISEDGYKVGIDFSQEVLPTTLPSIGNRRLRVVTHPYAFAIENYPTYSVVDNEPTTPPILDVDNNGYRSYLFQVNPSNGGAVTLVPWQQFSDQNQRRFFDVSFSSTENLLTARSCWASGNGPCTETSFEGTKFVTAMFMPMAPSSDHQFIRNVKDVYSVWNPSQISYNFDHFSISNAARIGAICLLNQTTHKVEFSLLQSMGTGFTQYPWDITLPLDSDPNTSVRQGDLSFVKSFTMHSNLLGAFDKSTRYDFLYLGPQSTSFNAKKPEYNAHLQSFIFPNTTVLTFRPTSANPNPTAEGAETCDHLVDEIENPIIEPYLVKAGVVTKTQVHDMDALQGNTISGRQLSQVDNEYYEPARAQSWPEKLFVVRLKNKTQTQFARNGSSKSLTTKFINYTAETNRPLFAKKKLDGDWFVSQTLYPVVGPNQTMPFGQATFKFTSEPSDATLETWADPSEKYNSGQNDQQVIANQKLEFDSNYPFLVSTTKVWRDKDVTLTDADLKKGEDPIYFADGGIEDANSVTRRTEYGQPNETWTIFNDDHTAAVPQATFYEGRASLLSGKIVNAYLDDASILTGESGAVTGLQSYDLDGRWPLQPGSPNNLNQAVIFSKDDAHTGEYSFCVQNHPGLTTDLKLKGVWGQGYDYSISTWIYVKSPGSSDPSLQYHPVISVQRFKGDGSYHETLPAVQDPVGAGFVYDKWQRYEFKITNSQLKGAQNLFANPNNGDFIRIQIGTGASLPGSAYKKIYVDDILCKPTSSYMSMFTYDEKGHLTTSTTNDFLTFAFDYDIFGNRAASRDDKGRIFNMTSAHFAGEND